MYLVNENPFQWDDPTPTISGTAAMHAAREDGQIERVQIDYDVSEENVAKKGLENEV